MNARVVIQNGKYAIVDGIGCEQRELVRGLTFEELKKLCLTNGSDWAKNTLEFLSLLDNYINCGGKYDL